MTDILLIVAALALVAACGAFVAAEFSLITVDRSEVEEKARAGDRRARGVRSALRALSTQLSAAQVGITVTNLSIGFLAEPSIARLVDGPLESLGVSGATATAISLVIALALATGVTMVFGELVPKNLAIARPLSTARGVQGFQRAFTRVTGPAIRVLNGTANAIIRRFGVQPQEELASARSAQELASLVRRSAQQGTLELETAHLLERSLAFGERRAVDVMTPRVRMRTLRATAPARSVLTEARTTGRSRFPVLATDSEDVVGIVHVKHAMGVPHVDRDEITVAEVMVPPVLVPSTLELDPLLQTLRRGGLQMAVVVDEFGAVDGIVTLEDLVEEIVGEVLDEHDTGDDAIRPLPDGGWLVSGLLRPDEVGDAIGAALPEDEDYETVAGLVGLRLGRIPAVGDMVRIESQDLERRPVEIALRVQRMDGLRVDRLHVIRSLPQEELER